MTLKLAGLTIGYQKRVDSGALSRAQRGWRMKRRGLLTFVFLAVLVFAGLALYGDLPDVLSQIASFPIAYWFIALGLALTNYVFRLLRWHYYLKLLGIRIGSRDSTAIFMSGLSMAISPGRVGELAKSYFLKEKLGVPVPLSSAVVVTERVTDLASILLLSLWGLALIPYGWAVALAIPAAFGLFLLLVVSQWGSDRLLRLPMPQGWRPFLSASRDTFRKLFSTRPLVMAILLGALAWFAEGCAMWLVLRGLDTTGSLGQAVSIYCAATLLGAITLLPGGLVGTEGGMVALLQRLDMSRTQASAATFIIRICTLWFAVFIGLLAVVYVQLYMPGKSAKGIEPLGLYPDIPEKTS